VCVVLILFGLLILLSSWSLTWGVRRYALANSVVDIPGSRSSHRVPTPRGGGIAIVICCSLAMAITAMAGWLVPDHLWAFLGAGWLVALIGFVDDHQPVSARWRFLVHLVASIWGVVWLGMPDVVVLGIQVELGWLWAPLVVIALVWLLNLYNFMDGIDGIAGVEAICVCLAGALFYCLLGAPYLAVVPAVLALACAGFLFWNLPPARIFMGDAGSGYLGLLLGLLSLQAASFEPRLLWAWLIMLGVFIVDTTTTLLRRLARGERFYLAHRSHAYQYAARLLGSHTPVTAAVFAINLFWLLPLSLWVVCGGDGLLVLLVAYAPLVALTIKLRAGLAE
jgi:Fuc2NAc and GlcNAc transferase